MTAVAATELVGLGVVIGAFGTLIGAGGGFLLVPLLLLVYHLSHPTAVGTSLALVFLNAASGTIAYLRQRRVDLHHCCAESRRAQLHGNGYRCGRQHWRFL